jgi:hypothetical protein
MSCLEQLDVAIDCIERWNDEPVSRIAELLRADYFVERGLKNVLRMLGPYEMLPATF